MEGAHCYNETKKPSAYRASARSEFWWGVASRVPWGWRDSYRKAGYFGRVGDKSMFKKYKKAGVGMGGLI